MRTRTLSLLSAALVVALQVSAISATAAPGDSSPPGQLPGSPIGAPAAIAADPELPDEVLIQLVSELGEARHFCVDIPGYPASGVIANHREARWALEAHTCKTGIPNQGIASRDQLISRSGIEDGQIRFTMVNGCLRLAMAALPVREDAPVIVDPCVGSPQEQLVFGDDGRIRAASDPAKCLTIGRYAYEASDRAAGQPWFRRALTFSTCEEGPSDRQIWAVVEVPDPSAPGPVDVPRDPRPAAAPARQIWEIVDPPQDGLAGAPTEDQTFIRLADELKEPRHFCVDIPGYPASGVIANHREAQWALEAHTCKTGVPNQNAAFKDQLISRSGIEDGQIKFTMVNGCLRLAMGVLPVREDAPVIVDPCVGSPQEQLVFGNDGRIRPVLDLTKCLTIGQEAFEAGDRSPGQPWFRRALTMSTCTPLTPSVTAAQIASAKVQYGADNSIKVRVSGKHGTPSGTVTVLAGAVEVGTGTLSSAGRANISLNRLALSPGTHTLTVSYSGDVRFESSVDTVEVKVVKATTKTKVKLTWESVEGRTGQVKVVVSSVAPVDGLVTIKEGRKIVIANVALVDGKATINLPNLTKGHHELTAYYLGSATTRPSTASPVKLKVLR